MQVVSEFQINEPPPLGSPDCQYPELTLPGRCISIIMYIPRSPDNEVRGGRASSMLCACLGSALHVAAAVCMIASSSGFALPFVTRPHLLRLDTSLVERVSACAYDR